VALLCGVSTAAAQSDGPPAPDPTTTATATSPPPPAKPTGGKLQKAKQLFREGNRLRRAGDYERALTYFLRSSKLVASVPNITNAAICLDKLERYDEALEHYELLLTKFHDELGGEQRQSVSKVMRWLRSKLGSVDVIANVDGALIIDGRPRGQLPLMTPVRVMPGTRRIHVFKDGFHTFEKSVEVKVGQTLSVPAKLEALAFAGRLQVDTLATKGGQVFIDGAMVGQAPWQGRLAPGKHVLWVVRGDTGSAPESVAIVRGQTVKATPAMSSLSGLLRFELEPPSAELRINGVLVGNGNWYGRLPLGKHTIDVREEGYLSKNEQFDVIAGKSSSFELRLTVDEAHARWGAQRSGEIFFDLIGGFVYAPSLGSAAEEHCEDKECRDNPGAFGAMVGARAGYELWFGLSVEAAGGYLSMGKRVHRTLNDTFGATQNGQKVSVDTRYLLTDDMSIGGPFAAAGVGYRLELGPYAQLRSHVLVGALFASTSDAIRGTVTASGGTLPVAVDGSGAASSSTNMFVMPELRVGARFGGFSVGAGVAVGIFVLEGAQYDNSGLALLDSNCDADNNPTGVDCTPARGFVTGERAHGPFVMISPSVSLGYAF